MTELEKYCFSEVNMEYGTFMHQFHKCHYFDVEKFGKLFNSVVELYNSYRGGNKPVYYGVLAHKIYDVFEPIPSMFYWHSIGKDGFTIKNFDNIKGHEYEIFELNKIILKELLSLSNS